MTTTFTSRCTLPTTCAALNVALNQTIFNEIYDNTYGPPPNLSFNPDTDVSGIGVLIGFVVTAYLVFALITVHYVIDYVPTHDTNNVDQRIVGFVWRNMPQYSRPSDEWGPGLRKLVLAFSDTQLVTGMAILAGAFSQLQCGIQLYAWQMIVYLAWFSSCTHMSTLTVLRPYFREHRVLRRSRLIAMLITVTMLIIALVPTASPNWEGSQSISIIDVPALCYYKWMDVNLGFGYFGDTDNNYMVLTGMISICYLGISYTVRAMKLSEAGSKWVRSWLRTKPSEVTQRCLRQLLGLSRDGEFSMIWAFAYEALLICFVFCRATADLFESMFWEIMWLLYALVWGTVRLFESRQPESSQLSYWSFGQWFPVLLLVLPFLSLMQFYAEMRDENENEHQGPNQYDAQPNLRRARGDTSDHGTTHSSNSATNSAGGPTALPSTVHTSPVLLSPGQSQLPMYKRDFYNFPWFRGLIGLITLMLTLLYALLLATSAIIGGPNQLGPGSESDSYSFFFTLFPVWMPVIIGGPLCYTALFVILEDLETPLASFFERRLKISRKHQRRIKGRLPILFGAVCVGLEIFLIGLYLYPLQHH